ncbi:MULTISPECIES: bifunctional UDP-N-acetylglucosamine diphosphorylase/glucosamine-1-phosphate N-acetyltransferase GlmU [unclassified Pseudovibrio]|uniref:bifunctional UDP-N-acetylglucosamine diphosphorylase/glucosamine-1-phosphate N-acetyltransferase GlmU n=1 Tax=unclassified Pseudovibrio TaxID=2627060 RepID=UPI0007AED00A|nr:MULTISPECIES: bifunctional UDP-N-acetylglucosamine diphosphorylase/glucosamine-1-phosphate N-acetyltransferase GlmU [unclassified Pseudovibrio]KZL02044.1 Bifunctional protein GlmU [Pseudovibrio sp. W74]KZL05249.1 Bifunctional protein GlmU [Pseudovibrio sp. Ad14]
MSNSSCLAIVLAAGLGTRMRSTLPKVMHEIGGLPLVGHVLNSVMHAGADKVAVVVGPEMAKLEEHVALRAPHATCHVQVDRLGTAHAVKAAEEAYNDASDHVLVLFGDTPLVKPDTLHRLRERLSGGADVVVLGFEAENPFGYGRLLESDGELVAIREEKEATDEERRVTLCNAGIMAFKGNALPDLIAEIKNDNAKGEYYLTDAVEVARNKGMKVVSELGDEKEVQGINNRAQLASCEAVFQQVQRETFMENGVTLRAPETVYFSFDTEIEPDVIVEPNVVFGPGVHVDGGARIRAFSHLENAHVSTDATVGPYARLRPGAEIGEGAHIGNFVEIKNAKVEAGAKVNHLSYIGDARIGAKSNIGAGTITCNYDGYLKHHTDIGAGSFVGSDSVLVAPVKLGDGAFVAAGSVVTSDVPADALAIGRGQQVNKEGRAAVMREKLAAAKASRKG